MEPRAPPPVSVSSAAGTSYLKRDVDLVLCGLSSAYDYHHVHSPGTRWRLQVKPEDDIGAGREDRLRAGTCFVFSGAHERLRETRRTTRLGEVQTGNSDGVEEAERTDAVRYHWYVVSNAG